MFVVQMEMNLQYLCVDVDLKYVLYIGLRIQFDYYKTFKIKTMYNL